MAARPAYARARAQSYPDALPLALGLVGIAAFVLVSVWRLDSLPPVYEDEPWQASTAYKLAREGVFGSDVFAGWNGMQQHYYGFLPVHPLILAGVFKVFGEGLLQARLEAIGASTLTLCLMLLLARRLFSAWVGVLALALLLFVRWTGTTYVQVTGIPFIDLARIARYDVVVPVFGLASLLAYVSANRLPPRHASSAARPAHPPSGAPPPHPRRWAQAALWSVWPYGLAGFLAGLAGLTHVYGLFWLIVLAVLAAWDGRGLRAIAWMGAGAVLPWLPYLAYVLADLPEWRAQVSGYADRFGLLDPRFYLSNLVEEPRRYGPGLGPLGPAWLVRPGFWTLLVLVPVSIIGLGMRALREHDHAARAIVAPAVLLPVFFALLLRLKLINYTLTFLPVEAIAAAWGILTALAWLRRRHLALSLGALLIGLAVLAEGTARLATLSTTTTTRYADFVAEVRRGIPAGARVIGLHNYWFGFEDTDYRSFVVPLAWMDPGGLTLEQALERLAPDVVLLDDRMRTYLTYDPRARAGFEAWLTASDARLADQVDDPTYGLLQIYASNATLLKRPAYTGPAIGEHGGKF